MPRYDYTCDTCGAKATDVFLSRDEIDTTRTQPCPCGATADRDFPLTARPVVDWGKPEFSWRHGKTFHNTKEVDAANKELREPNLEKQAKQYACVEAEYRATVGEEKYEELKNATGL